MPLYTITNQDPNSAGHGRVYVGSCTITIQRRMARHYYLGEHATDKSPALYRDMQATLQRVRQKADSRGRTTTSILSEYYPTELNCPNEATCTVEDLRAREQALLDSTKRLTLLPCYNARRPQAIATSEEKREKIKTAYHAAKQLCSCGRMVSKINSAHLRTAVHLRG